MSDDTGPTPPSAPIEAAAPAPASSTPVPRTRRSSRRSMSRRAYRGIVRLIQVLRANVLSLVGFILVVLIVGGAFIIWLVPNFTGFFAQPIVLFHLFGHTVAIPQIFRMSYSVLPYGPNQISPTTAPQPPSWQHWFGTDNLGRDIFSRTLYAAPLDLGIGISITGISLLIGGGLGLVSGYWDSPGPWRRILSATILRVTDVFLAFPSLVLALALAAIFGRGLGAGYLSLLLTWWPYYVRLVRGEVLAIKYQPYVVAARAAGVSDTRILTRHVLRNIVEPIVVYFTLDIGSVLVTFSTISFVGVGPNSSVPEWGSMVQYYQTAGFLLTYPWTIAAPGLAIFISVLAFSLLGDGLRDVLDPRTRRALSAADTDTRLPEEAPPAPVPNVAPE
ncbi:MAG: ABC transporter permease [Thermoplasmata archaeon]